MSLHLGDYVLLAGNLLTALALDVIHALNDLHPQPTAAEYLMDKHKQTVHLFAASMTLTLILLLASLHYATEVTFGCIQFSLATLVWSFVFSISCFLLLPASYITTTIAYFTPEVAAAAATADDDVDNDDQNMPQGDSIDSIDPVPEAAHIPLKCRAELNIPKMANVGQRDEESINDIMSKALHGKLDCDYPETSKIVRIFTSSTFTGNKISNIGLANYKT